MYIYVHAYARTRTHTDKRTHTRARTRTHTDKRTHTRALAHAHKPTPFHAQPCTRRCRNAAMPQCAPPSVLVTAISAIDAHAHTSDRGSGACWRGHAAQSQCIDGRVRRVLVQMRGASEHGELNRAQQGGTGQSADRHQWRDSAAPLAPSNTVSPRCHSTGTISESVPQTDDSTRVIAHYTRSLRSSTLRGLGSGGSVRYA
jgi:hypothetical protein